MPFIALSRPGQLIIIGQLMEREACGTDVTDQFNDLLRRMIGGRAVSTLPRPPTATQSRIHRAVEAFRGGGVGNVLEEGNDTMTKELVAQGPGMFMLLVEELKAREAALCQAVYGAEKNGMPLECVSRFRNLVTKMHVDALRMTWEESRRKVWSQ